MAGDDQQDDPKKESPSAEEGSGSAEDGEKPGTEAGTKPEAEAKPKAEEAEAKPKAEEAEAKPKAEEAEAKPKAEEAEAKPKAEAEDEDSDDDGDEPEAKSRDSAEDADGDERTDEESAEAEAEEEPESKRSLSDPVGGHRTPERKASAWGRPLARLDATWTKFEARLCAVVVILEVIALSLWVTLKGLSSSSTGGSNAGIVFRAVAGALVLGLIGFFALRKKGKKFERIGALGGMFLGFVLAKAWADKGIDWSSNLLNWYQQASFLTLLGGLRGVGTRLTLLLALLGGSLATAAGKHITIDLVTRFLKPKARLPLVIAGWVGSAVICATTAWGFFDHIAIEDFGAKADVSAGAKIKQVTDGLREDFFIARKQFGLDLRTLPRVIKGDRYSEWLTGAEWNKWLDESGFADRYGKEAVDGLKMSDLEGTRSPIVVVPERGEPRGELIKAANLVFPIGLWIIAIRFILLALLAASGHLLVDPESHLDVGTGRKETEPKEGEEEEAR